MTDQTTAPEAVQSVSVSGEFMGLKAIITFRDVDVDMKPIVTKTENGIKWMVERGWVPERKGFGVKKEIEYVQLNGSPMVCPMCKVGKIKIIHAKDGKTYYGCDQSKYDPMTKTSTGCKYFSSQDPSVKQNVDITGHEWDGQYGEPQ